MNTRLQEQLDVADKIDIDYLHGIVRYILGKTTSEGKAVMSAADEIDRLETHKQQCFDRMRTMTERIAELETESEARRVECTQHWRECQTLKERLRKLGYDD